MLRRIVATLLFSFALIFALIFFLLNGIKLKSFSFGQIYISQLYIKLNKKLIVDIDEVRLSANSKVQSSYEDLEKNIKKIPTLLKYFEHIDIESLTISGNNFKILFDNDHLYLDNKFVNISSKYAATDDILNLELYSLYLKDINLLLRGNINLDYYDKKMSFYGNYVLNDNVEGELNTQFSKENIDFFVTTNEVENLKFLKKLFRLDKIAEEWMYENVHGNMQLKYLYGKLNPKTFEPILNSIKGEALIQDAKIHFNKKVAPVETSNLFLTYENDTLTFELYKPTYKNLDIDGSKVEISNLTSTSKGRVDVLIQTKEVLNDEILAILKAYDLDLPIKQLSGKTDAHVLLKIPYENPMQTYGNFVLKDSKLLINNKFPFITKYANIELKNTDVIIKESNFNIENLLDSTVDLTINAKTLRAKGSARIDTFLIKSDNKEIINLKNITSPISLNFNDNTLIRIPKLNTGIVLNKDLTEVNIDNLQSIYQYSQVLKENKLKQGHLDLFIYDENHIVFTGKVEGLSLPIKRGEKHITSIDLSGELKNKNLSITSKQEDIHLDIKENEALKITLENMNIFPLENKNNNFQERIQLKLLNSAVHLSEDTFFVKDMNVILDKSKVSFDGIVEQLDIPIMHKNKKVTSLDVIGTVKDETTQIRTKDNRLYMSIIDDKEYLIKLNNLDLTYNTADKSSVDKNIQIVGKNSNIILNNKYKALSTKYDFVVNDEITKFKLYHKKTHMDYIKDKDGLISLRANNVTDEFINSFFGKKFVEGGTLEVEATGKDHIITGRINFKENKIKNLTTLNNVIILVNTSPALVNPFLAIPTIFGMVTSDGFNVNGYKVNKGYVDFTYNSDKKFLNMYAINTKGNSVDFDGFSTFDFEKNIVHSDVKLIFMKGYSSVIDAIPGLDYILLGDDKQISTMVNIRGNIDKPDIKTNVLKDSASAPFDVLKRIFTLPLKPFLD